MAFACLSICLLTRMSEIVGLTQKLCHSEILRLAERRVFIRRRQWKLSVTEYSTLRCVKDRLSTGRPSRCVVAMTTGACPALMSSLCHVVAATHAAADCSGIPTVAVDHDSSASEHGTVKTKLHLSDLLCICRGFVVHYLQTVAVANSSGN